MALHFRSLAAAALSIALAAQPHVAFAQARPAQQPAPAASAPAPQPAAPPAAAIPPATTSPMAAPVVAPAAPVQVELPTAEAAPAGEPAQSTTSEPTVSNASPGTIPGHMLPHDLTPWQMFLDADIVVKAVMIGLAFASVVTWTVWFAKSLELRFEKRRARRKNKWLEHAKSLADAEREFAKEKDPVARLVRAAAHELELSRALPKEGVNVDCH